MGIYCMFKDVRDRSITLCCVSLWRSWNFYAWLNTALLPCANLVLSVILRTFEIVSWYYATLPNGDLLYSSKLCLIWSKSIFPSVRPSDPKFFRSLLKSWKRVRSQLSESPKSIWKFGQSSSKMIEIKKNQLPQSGKVCLIMKLIFL